MIILILIFAYINLKKIEIMKKSDLKSLVKQAEKMVAEHKGISICFQIYCGGNCILDTEEDNVIDISRTEQEAIEIINGMKEEGCDNLYYKPIIIDSISGKRITRKTIDNYK